MAKGKSEKKGKNKGGKGKKEKKLKKTLKKSSGGSAAVSSGESKPAVGSPKKTTLMEDVLNDCATIVDCCSELIAETERSAAPATSGTVPLPLRRGAAAGKEYLVTPLCVSSILTRLSKPKKVKNFLRPLADAMRLYRDAVVEIRACGLLDRFLENPRLRHCVLDTHIARVEAALRDFRRNEEVAANLSAPLKSEQPAAVSLGLSTVLEFDRSAEGMWNRRFGEATFWVEWPFFLAALADHLSIVIDREIGLLLKTTMDPNEVGWTSKLRFAGFLAGFGALSPNVGPHCISNMQSIAAERWWFGFCSKQEADALLRHEGNGAFIVRISGAIPSNFVLSFQASGKCMNVLVESTCPGLRVNERGSVVKLFHRLEEVVQSFEHVLKRAVRDALPRHVSYIGDVDGAEVVELLRGQAPGTFVTRLSSRNQGDIVVSFVTRESEFRVANWLVRRLDDGRFALEDQPEERYSSIAELTEAHKASLNAAMRPTVWQSTEFLDIASTWREERQARDEVVESVWKPFLDE